jgi:hypothetical protein
VPIGSWKDTPNKMEESSNVFKVTHLLCCYDVYSPCADRVLTVYSLCHLMISLVFSLVCVFASIDGKSAETPSSP